MRFGSQLKLLLWKNYKLKVHSPAGIVAEILWPLFLFGLLSWVRTRDVKNYIPECYFDGKAMPSAGLWPFIQDFMCTVNNTCYQTITADEQQDATNKSLLAKLFLEFEELFRTPSSLSTLAIVVEDLTALISLQNHVSNGDLNCSLKLDTFLRNSEALKKQLMIPSMNKSVPQMQEILSSSLNSRQMMDLLLATSGGLMAGSKLDPQAQKAAQMSATTQVATQLYSKWCGPSQSPTLQALCALDQTQFTQLAIGLQKDVTPTLLISELDKCAKKTTGKDFNISADMLRNTGNLFGDFEQLQVLLTELSTTVNETMTEVLENMPNETFWINGTNGTIPNSRFLGKLLCSRDTRLLIRSPQVAGYSPGGSSDSNTGPLVKGEDISMDLIYDNSTTLFCNAMVAQMQETIVTRILWKNVKPMIRGRIPYTPDTPITRQIIKEANSTFEALSQVLQLANDWLDASPTIYEYIDSNPNMDVVRNALELLAPQNPLAATFSQLLSQEPPEDGAMDWKTALNYTDIVFEYLRNYLECLRLDKFVGYKDEEALMEASAIMLENHELWAGLVFEISETATTFPTHMSYKIRMDARHVDTTNKGKVQDQYWKPGARSRPLPDMKYIIYGFAYIQDMVEHGMIRMQTGLTEDYGVVLQQFPYPCFIFDQFIMAISRSLPMFMVLAWIYSVSMNVKNIVYEKETRLKEVMKAMGLSNTVHWVAWFITCFSMMFISATILLIILTAGRVVPNTDPSVLLLFMFSFLMATITLCFLISTFFSHANLAAACAGVFYFTSYLPFRMAFRYEESMTLLGKAAVSLLGNVAFGYGCSYLARYEEQGVGLQWHNVARSPIPGDSYSMAGCICMLVIDSIIYSLLTWYIEAVFPGKYGMPRQWYFPVTRTYWFGDKLSDMRDYSDSSHEYELNNTHADSNFEAEPTDIPLGVSIRGLKKVYSRGNKLAVNGLNLNFYEGQITSFLGHNGAGKTTTMSILMGLYPPTQGTALIYGRDIRYHMDAIRQSLGVCPQHNVLFDNLTVAEHLWFYGRLKGMTSEEVNLEMDIMIANIGLPTKKHELSKNLSGGMKRKLSVAMAFVAGSKVVILDEPTAGVDPYARRSIWDLLLKYREGRTILLSTHFMDEADILGDRIAIISQGQLRCCGSSLFLKSQYGSGYYLTLVKKAQVAAYSGSATKRAPTPPRRQEPICKSCNLKLTYCYCGTGSESIETNDSMKGSADIVLSPPSGGKPEGVATLPDVFSEEKMTAFVKTHVPKAILVENTGTEVCYQMPADGAKSGAFEKLFLALESDMSSLCVSSYGITDTTLEEIFLKVADVTGVDKDLDEINSMIQVTDGAVPRRSLPRTLKCRLSGISAGLLKAVSKQSGISALSESVKNCTGAGRYRMTGRALVFHQFWALWIKRFHNVRRSRKGWVCEIILPAVFICLAMLFARLTTLEPVQPPLELHPWRLTPSRTDDPNLYWFFSNNEQGAEWTDEFESLLTTQGGVGTRCMDPSVHTIPGYPCVDVPPGLGLWTPAPKSNDTGEDCDCSSGWQVCSDNAVGPEPSRRYLPTGDYLYNVTGANITEWLLKTTHEFQQRRFGGLSFGKRKGPVDQNDTEMTLMMERLHTALSADADLSVNTTLNVSTLLQDLEQVVPSLSNRKIVKIWFNNKGYVSMVSYMNIMNNLIMRANLPPGTDLSKYGMAAFNHPMNRTEKQLEEFLIETTARDVLTAISVIFALSFIPASFILFLIDERTTNAKHLQFVSGVNHTVYWVATFTWDMVNYLFPCILCFFIFLAFGQKSFVSANNAPCLAALLFLYGFAVTPMMYPSSFFFNVPSSAFVTLSCMNVFLGIVSTVTTFVLEALAHEDAELYYINSVLQKVFLILPHFCLGRGLMDMTSNQLRSDIMKHLGEDSFISPFSFDLVGTNLLCLLAQGIIFFGITLLIEHKFFGDKCYSTSQFRRASLADINEDVDVATERQRVMNGGSPNDVLKIEELTKVFRGEPLHPLHYFKYWIRQQIVPKKGKKHPAVDGIAVGVHKGECFGLLGVNGAGKTTTFKMLTGCVSPTAGNAYLAGHSILTDMTSVHQLLGYCPQFDAIFPLLTAREHLAFYARLRGVPEEDVAVVTEWGIHKLGLIQYATQVAGDYSGGNKRKLSTAIALIGNPPVIFLDEPTTGMDPKSRRFLWNCIGKVIKDGRSVVLTSHSMEECEALCSRLAIMVNGTFQCMGSVQHLKSRFGEGYTIVVRVAGSSPDMKPLVHYMGVVFPAAVLKEHHHNVLHYQLGLHSGTRLSSIFGHLEDVKQRYNIEDYSVSQTTLDEVFINFAKLQTDLHDDELPAGLTIRDLAFKLIEVTPIRSEPKRKPDTARTNGGLQLHKHDRDEESLSESLIELAPWVRPPARTVPTGSRPSRSDTTESGPARSGPTK